MLGAPSWLCPGRKTTLGAIMAPQGSQLQMIVRVSHTQGKRYQHWLWFNEGCVIVEGVGLMKKP